MRESTWDACRHGIRLNAGGEIEYDAAILPLLLDEGVSITLLLGLVEDNLVNGEGVAEIDWIGVRGDFEYVSATW